MPDVWHMHDLRRARSGVTAKEAELSSLQTEVHGKRPLRQLREQASGLREHPLLPAREGVLAER